MLSTYQYFQSKFDNDLKPALLAFKAARYFSPSKICELKPSSADIDSLCNFIFLNSSSVIDGLKTELPQYLASAKLCLTKSMLFNGGRLMSLNSPVGQEHSSLYCLCNHLLRHLKVFSILTNSFSTQQARFIYRGLCSVMSYVTVQLSLLILYHFCS